MLKPMNIQLFAEPNNDPKPGADPTPQTFSAEYVSDLRSESAGYRTRAKNYETALRSVLGLKDTDELGDVNARVSAFQQNLTTQQQAARQAADKRIIGAQMSSLEGYDVKLLEKVIDLSDVTVKDDGTVEGLQAAAEKAAQEFPAVKISRPAPFARANTPPQDKKNDKEKANAALRALFGKDG